MKKWTALLCCIALLVSGWSGVSQGAYADEISIEEKANILNQIDLLAGDGTSFNLDQPLRRCDAAAFLVKALGKNVIVLQNKAIYSKTRFKDVPSTAWYAPYVGYMTEMNIITGNTDGTFAPNEFISEKAFFSLLLKSMGYTTSDFTWNNINQFAYETGVVTDIAYVFKDDDNTNYKRAGVVNALYNALSKPMKGQNKNFAELLVAGKVISSDKAQSLGFIKVDKLATSITAVKVLSSKQIEVTFNEPVKVPKIEQVQMYTRENSLVKLAVKQVQVNSNVMTIDMETQSDKANYIVDISNIEDAIGNVIKSLKKDFVGYSAVEVASPYFMISKVEPISQKSVNIYFTHPITEKAELELLYDIYLGETRVIEGNYKSVSLKRNSTKTNMITLSLKEGSFDIGREYGIRIKGDLVSSYGVNLNKGNGETMTFMGTAGTVSNVALSQVYSQEGIYVYLTYTEAVDGNTAKQIANYTIREIETNRMINITQVYPMKSKEVLDKGYVLKTEGLTIGKTYEIIARNIYDNVKTSSIPEMKTQFSGTYTSADILMLQSVTPIDNTTIALTFNKELKETSANANVVVEGGISVAMKVVDPENPKRLIVYLNAYNPLQVGRQYYVSAYTGIVDFMEKNQTYILSGNVIGNGAVKEMVGISSANFIGDSTIMIKYNQAISKTQSASVTQYDIYYSDGKTERLLMPGTAELVSDRVVVLKLPYLLPTGTFRVQAKNIYDVSNQYRSVLINAEVK